MKKRNKLKKFFKKLDTSKIALIAIGLTVILFTVAVLYIFRETSSEPSTLIACFFTAMTGECGFMAWIKTNKNKYLGEDNKEKEANDGECNG